MNNRILSGKEAICNFVGRGWATVEKWIINDKFPARKIDGRWESDVTLIDSWRRRQIKKAALQKKSEAQA